MIRASKRGLIRLVSLHQIASLASTITTKSTALIESLLVGVPRQLGRGKVDSSPGARKLNSNGIYTDQDLDGSYLSQMSGSGK